MTWFTIRRAAIVALSLGFAASAPPVASAPAFPDTAAAAAPRDDSRDWQPVSGAEAELDSLLVEGAGLVLAFEDTFAFDPDSADTVLVSAPRVTVAEVIAAIGRRMEYDAARKRSVEYTTLVTQVLRDDDTPDSDYSVEEYALRYREDRDLGDQVATLWERKRRYEDGELVEDESDDEMDVEILDVQERVIGDMPFSPGGAHRYHYEIEDRLLVGNNLIYRVAFRPKSRFEALPSGTVWVDYTNWVIRKLEARMTGVVPYPMFLKSIPVIRLAREQFGDYWFTPHVYMRVVLRDLPLLPIPHSIEVRVRTQDVVINGTPVAPGGEVPGAGSTDLTEEDLAGGFWLTPEANADSLAAFWTELDAEWEKEIPVDIAEMTLAPARIDSLSAAGATALDDLREGTHWRGEFDPVRRPGYNRVQGFVPRAGFTLGAMGPHKPRLALEAGYGFAKKRPVFGAELELPLWVARWSVDDPTRAGRRADGARYQRLGLRLTARKDAALFAGDGRRHTRSFTAFAYGSDPNHYYEERSFEGVLTWRLARGLAVRAGGGYAEHRAWAQETSWNVLGRQLRPDGNRAAVALDDVAWSAGASFESGPLALDGAVTWHRPGAVGSGGGGADLREWRVNGSLDLLDGMGNHWLLRGSHREFDGAAPLQWKSWLGDWGTLRGYRAGVLTGDAGAHASLDARFGVDVWQALRVPVLKDWGLQPIGFVDWGKAWDAPGGAIGPDEGVRDWRMDVGFGFGKRFDMPGLGEFNNLRVYAAHGVANGSEGEGWRVLVGFEK